MFEGMFSATAVTIGGLLVLCSLLALVELVDLARHWRSPGHISSPSSQPTVCPFVSLHVPICSEPVEVVEATLRAIAALDYPNFEAVVVYNNTSDRNLWEPIARLCADLGPRFRFYFVRQLSGFKAGALNYALGHTSLDADLIGVIDADYVISPDYLKEVVPHFADERIGFLQTPQDYRSIGQSWFAIACYWEYWQFFEVGMTIRSLRNAPMLHGTMALVRKSALLQASGWATWCVTEDSELGLRLLALGYQGRYIKVTYGRGLLPFSFRDYKRQRWRWVAGGAQQLRRHLPKLMTGHELTFPQKAHHLQGWLPWFRDGLLAASLPLLAPLALGLIVNPDGSLLPLRAIGAGVASVMLQGLVWQILVYRVRLRLSWSETLGAAAAISSLTLTIGIAWTLAMFGRRTPFVITPKKPHPGNGAWQDIRLELAAGGYVAALALMLLAADDARVAAAALVPGLYLLLLAPAYCMFLASGKAADREQFSHHIPVEGPTSQMAAH